MERPRAAQVGFLLKSYRESFSAGNGQRGLTQEELLRRMALVDSDYAERYSHSTVSRWESGTTRPTIQRLLVLGTALELPRDEVAGLILLAGLAPDFSTAMQCVSAGDKTARAQKSESTGRDTGYGVARYAGRTDMIDALSRVQGTVGFAVMRFLALGLCVAGGGYGLAFFGWNDAWMPVTYVGFVTALVLAQWFLLPGGDDGLSEFYSVSVFFVLTTPLLQFAPIHMDHYNFYTVGSWAGTHLPYMLALSVNLVLALLAGLTFRFLRRRQFLGARGWSDPIRRAAWVALPPIGFVYAVVVVISNTSVWIQFAVLMPVLAAVFTILLVLRDPAVNPNQRDRMYLFYTVVPVAIVSTTLGILTILAIYVSPDLPTVLPDHNLMGSWEIDFTELGYSREEALERLNLGYMWHAMCLMAYMVFIVGGYLISAICRIGDGNDAAEHAGEPSRPR